MALFLDKPPWRCVHFGPQAEWLSAETSALILHMPAWAACLAMPRVQRFASGVGGAFEGV
eukprot:11406651-Alexandrium_andersonii.AAC.1